MQQMSGEVCERMGALWLVVHVCASCVCLMCAAYCLCVGALSVCFVSVGCACVLSVCFGYELCACARACVLCACSVL